MNPKIHGRPRYGAVSRSATIILRVEPEIKNTLIESAAAEEQTLSDHVHDWLEVIVDKIKEGEENEQA